jgi:NitT/TauT family transport system substrate-binding protein
MSCLSSRRLMVMLSAITIMLAGTTPLETLSADALSLRVATLPIESTADVYYAQDEGFFKDAGLNVTIEQSAGGSVILSAVEGGSYDIGMSNFVTVAGAKAHGIPLSIIAPSGMHVSSAPSELLMVKQSAAIRAAADLNGKTIAVNVLNALSQLAGETWIAKNGGDLKSVHFVEIPYPAMLEALQAGRVDAIAIAEPFATPAKAVARALADTYDAISPRFIFGCWVATDAWLQQHGDEAKRFITAIRRAHEWANSHVTESAAILVAHTKLTPQILSTMTRTVYATTLDQKLIAPFLDAGTKFGALPRTMSVSELVWKNAT